MWNFIKNNWDRIDSLMMIVIGIVAIAVPAQIAKKQNKIALYEKRFVYYEQFEALKQFWLYVKDIDGLTKESINEAVLECQYSYFNAHSVLEDKDFWRKGLDGKYQLFYVKSCLEIDRKMFLSIKLLIATNSQTECIEKAQYALEVFVEQLFFKAAEQYKTNSSMGEKVYDYEGFICKKARFIEEFERMLDVEKQFERLLKIQK